MTSVFLDGSRNGSDWRERLIALLETAYYDDPTAECCSSRWAEIKRRVRCDYHLYVVTPKMPSFAVVAAAVDASNKQPDRTIFCVLQQDDGLEFTADQLHSLQAVAALVQRNGAQSFDTLEAVADFLNSRQGGRKGRKGRG